MITPKQRESRELIVEYILHPHMHKATAEHLAEEIVEALTAHTEPEDETCTCVIDDGHVMVSWDCPIHIMPQDCYIWNDANTEPEDGGLEWFTLHPETAHYVIDQLDKNGGLVKKNSVSLPHTELQDGE